MLFTDIGQSCPSCEFLTSKIYPLGQSFFIFCFTDFFGQMWESEDEKKNKKKIQDWLFFFSDISDVKVGGRKKKDPLLFLSFFIEHCWNT